jgi:hypothetical protein
MVRKCAPELPGTGLLVFFGVGVATLMFGFRFDGGSMAAGIVATGRPGSTTSSSRRPLPSGPRFAANSQLATRFFVISEDSGC